MKTWKWLWNGRKWNRNIHVIFFKLQIDDFSDEMLQQIFVCSNESDCFRMAELQFGTEQGKLRGMCEMRGKVRKLLIFPFVFFNMFSSLVGSFYALKSPKLKVNIHTPNGLLCL